MARERQSVRRAKKLMGEGVGVWGCMHAAVLFIFPIQVAMVAMLKKNES